GTRAGTGGCGPGVARARGLAPAGIVGPGGGGVAAPRGCRRALVGRRCRGSGHRPRRARGAGRRCQRWQRPAATRQRPAVRRAGVVRLGRPRIGARRCGGRGVGTGATEGCRRAAGRRQHARVHRDQPVRHQHVLLRGRARVLARRGAGAGPFDPVTRRTPL
ncbi:MAG: hypothetical protein AVDCRST_MAG18-1397, partial [uncultured Thermomicrobiales bacterium]